MSNVLIGEFIGTMLLVLLGDGVCANVTLNNSGFKAAGPLFIALGWGLAVCLPAAAMGGIAENFPASYNPALTVALAADGSLLAGKFTIGTVIGMIIAEMAGGFVGAILVWIAFKPQFDASSDLGDSLRGVEILSINETVGLGMNAKNESFRLQYLNKKVDSFVITKTGKEKDNEIDSLSSATITSKAVTNGVNGALDFYDLLKGDGQHE